MAGTGNDWLKTACISMLYLAFLGSASVFAASENPAGGTLLWQGFDHEWRRFVVLPREGRVPHRISRLASYTQTDAVSQSDISGSFRFAQSTGVDGNYMWPSGYWSAIYSPDVTVLQQSRQLQWTDAINASGASNAPFATSDKTLDIQLTVPEGSQVAAILNGIDLEVSCDNSKQPADLPCNSDGLWPYDFYVGFDQCRTVAENGTTMGANTRTLNCPLQIRIHRGWTPNKGGLQIPPFFNEIKPLNHRLDISMTVHYSLLQGPDTALHTTYPDPFIHTRSLQNIQPMQGEHVMTWQDAFPDSRLASGITGFGFQLHEPLAMLDVWHLLGSDTRRLGRYIARLRFQTDNPDLDQDHTLLTLPYSTHVWSPITVVDSLVTTRLETAILEFAENSFTGNQNRARGKLCINSTDQAPAFSRWQFCSLNHWLARWIYGNEQASDSVSIGDAIPNLSR